MFYVVLLLIMFIANFLLGTIFFMFAPMKEMAIVLFIVSAFVLYDNRKLRGFAEENMNVNLEKLRYLYLVINIILGIALTRTWYS